jgi:hypothetical protein
MVDVNVHFHESQFNYLCFGFVEEKTLSKFELSVCSFLDVIDNQYSFIQFI